MCQDDKTRPCLQRALTVMDTERQLKAMCVYLVAQHCGYGSGGPGQRTEAGSTEQEVLKDRGCSKAPPVLERSPGPQALSPTSILAFPFSLIPPGPEDSPLSPQHLSRFSSVSGCLCKPTPSTPPHLSLLLLLQGQVSDRLYARSPVRCLELTYVLVPAGPPY